MKISIVQFAPVLGDINGNISLLSENFRDAWESDLVVLPELASSGYRFNGRDEALASAEQVDDSRYIDFLESMAGTYDCHIVSGFNEKDGDKLYNSSVLVGPQGLLGIYRKLHLFRDEKNIFAPGNLGAEVFDTPLGKIGMLVCFDWMFPEVWRKMALAGAQLVCHPSNLVLPYCQTAVQAHSLLNRMFVATANRIGKERDLAFTGQSVLYSPKGEVLGKGSIDKSELITVEIDLKDADDKWITSENHIFYDRRVDVYNDLSD
ncbi:MAG: nitrilase-related carbon-nitrogen hydrolase [Breznakibacter sp.]